MHHHVDVVDNELSKQLNQSHADGFVALIQHACDKQQASCIPIHEILKQP
jgi:hypothetical protein